jgi:hypothetical protein
MHTYINAHSHRDSDRYVYTDAKTDGYSDIYSYGHIYADSYIHAYSHSYCNCNGNVYSNPDGDSYCRVYANTNTYATNDRRHYQDVQLDQSHDHFSEQCCGRPSSYGIGHDLAAGY